MSLWRIPNQLRIGAESFRYSRAPNVDTCTVGSHDNANVTVTRPTDESNPMDEIKFSEIAALYTTLSGRLRQKGMCIRFDDIDSPSKRSFKA